MNFSVKDRGKMLYYFARTPVIQPYVLSLILLRIKLSWVFTNSSHTSKVPRSFTFHAFYSFLSNLLFLSAQLQPYPNLPSAGPHVVPPPRPLIFCILTLTFCILPNTTPTSLKATTQKC